MHTPVVCAVEALIRLPYDVLLPQQGDGMRLPVGELTLQGQGHQYLCRGLLTSSFAVSTSSSTTDPAIIVGALSEPARGRSGRLAAAKLRCFEREGAMQAGTRGAMKHVHVPMHIASRASRARIAG
eukprot:CAMPEP_0206264876 /NCGR_PEP_ID=MMETSP0047_2-20121206/29665_1 /ASSEMBLY_ACC=CAM_ASM_000192 /TAXON_ID=195065 /ORGANISM="Chroomonas mesostigmatica_cf, Strain CCMP1168" /LENGTH=125 /DNA_ID=CAMNT_0053692673 /DNA_START=1183 /DNA_END=1558 /DNA_ORIENTATION=+